MPAVTLGPLSDLAPGAMAVYTVAGEPILVLRVDDELYAMHNICSHAYAKLSEGEFDPDECTIECPLHGSTFDIRTGIPRVFPAFEPVATYPVRVEDGQIILEFTE
jgi:3-phenylpropionate/trans-cinnamate dioxygenase ferredoxin component